MRKPSVFEKILTVLLGYILIPLVLCIPFYLSIYNLTFLNAVFEKAKELNFEYLWLCVYDKNERAINFYKRNDFTAIGTHTFYVNNTGYPNIVLLKKL